MILVLTLSFILFCVGTVLVLGLTPDRVTSDISRLLLPDRSLRDMALERQGKLKKTGIVKAVIHFRDALNAGSDPSAFGKACIAAIFFSGAGLSLSVAIRNYWLAPVLAVSGLFVPFFVAWKELADYDRRIDEELETTLSIVTSAYLRTGDIVGAVKENLGSMKAPVSDVFSDFYNRATMISSDIKGCIRILQLRIDNTVFFDWCETLIACQDDFSGADALIPTVARLTEIRLVNSELRTKINSCRREYWSMVLIVLFNIPLLYLINRDWFSALVNTRGGQISLAVSAAVILLTSILMTKYTRPLRYEKRKK